jgi:hypothetical protein
MSVTLKRPYGLFAAGATVTLPNETESALIAQGLAEAAVSDTVGLIPLYLVRDASGVLGVLDQTTGAVVPFQDAVAAITSGTIDGAAIGGTAPAAGAFTTLNATGAFACNGAASQAPVVAGAELAAYGTGAFGLDSDAAMEAMYDLVVAMRAALVANGIMAAA